MAKWSKRTFKMPKRHGWEAVPGHNIVMADAGAVRLNQRLCCKILS